MKLNELNLTKKQAGAIENQYGTMSIHGVVYIFLNSETNKTANFALNSYTPGEDLIQNFKGTVRTTPDFTKFDRVFLCRERNVFSVPEWSEVVYADTIKEVKDVVEYTKNR